MTTGRADAMVDGQHVSDDERARRQQTVDEVRTSTALEGGRASGLTHAAQDRWVTGELTFEEMAAEIRRAHPSTADDETLPR